ncbi:hypothetical protein OOK41_13750 [Micromonospora sp. NBC_01655]|uniref:hypothetical protein n=1 Tax=Micromonospora sp. NBC_01655 TaxID=2975983 RepID=UPI00224F1CD8|nr:hypothetical protein [Micromonospora sp. NBC_01655]MCX4471359.1 hypothetical protein [Micromonospora sp. NBC_01655]
MADDHVGWVPSGLGSVRPPDEFDNSIDVSGFLDRTDQQSTSLRGAGAGEQEQCGCAMAGAEALGPNQDAAAAGPDCLAEGLGEVRRLAVGLVQALAVS